MRCYMNLAVLALVASTITPALSAPAQNRYGNLLVGFEGRAFLINGISLGTFRLGRIPILLSMSLVADSQLVGSPCQ